MRTPSIDAPDLALSDLMKTWPQTVEVFLRHRMLCPGCVFAPFDTVIDACREYGLDEGAFRAALAEAVSGRV